jgi:hypothetical protein
MDERYPIGEYELPLSAAGREAAIAEIAEIERAPR